MKYTWKVLKGVISKTNKTKGIEKINFEDHEITDKKQITKKCDEHFVSIGDTIAKEIQTVDTLSPTGHITPAITVNSDLSLFQSRRLPRLSKLLNGKATGVHGTPIRL